ncbi:MAG TPA: universal stress protein [Mucilaginibacter sp.]
MKTILILTDFSENATHAAISSVMLSEKLHANLLLLNNITGIPVTPYYLGGGLVAEEASWLVEESKKNLKKLTESLEPVIARLDPEQHKPTVHTQIEEGSLGENITAILDQKNIEMVVIGGKTGSSFDHILLGSDTLSVIKHSNRPVLVVPFEADFKKLKKVVFATDFNEADINAMHFLVKLGKQFDFQLEIVHVSLIGENDKHDNDKETRFLSKVDKLKYPKIVYKHIRGKDVIERLNRFCEETKADVLALVHYSHSFFLRILQDSHTQKALSSQNVPLLVFPAGMEEKV